MSEPSMGSAWESIVSARCIVSSVMHLFYSPLVCYANSMQTGQFILHRQMVDIIREICAKKGIECTSLSNDWLLELKKGGKTKRVLGYKFSLNDSVSSSIAGDKVAAHLLLKRGG